MDFFPILSLSLFLHVNEYIDRLSVLDGLSDEKFLCVLIMRFIFRFLLFPFYCHICLCDDGVSIRRFLKKFFTFFKCSEEKISMKIWWQSTKCCYYSTRNEKFYTHQYAYSFKIYIIILKPWQINEMEFFPVPFQL